MKSFLKNYKQTLILLAAIIIGAIVGLCCGEKATVLSPLGDIFINLMFIIIVLLIFLTISTSISKISQPERIGKTLGTTVLVFIITSLIGMFAAYPFKLVSVEDGETIKANLFDEYNDDSEELSLLEKTIFVLTVDDFLKLLSRQNIVATIVFSIIFGCSIRMSGEKGKPIITLLESLTDIIISLLNIVMYYAPVGLGCYFAALIGTFGGSIAVGYLKTFILLKQFQCKYWNLNKIVL